MAEHENQPAWQRQSSDAERAPSGPEEAPLASPGNVLLQQQQRVGNQAVQRHVRQGTLPGEALVSQHGTLGNQAVQRLLRGRSLQAKLTVSSPGDQYEEEADAVASAVMRQEEAVPAVQRQAEASGEMEVAPEVEARITGLHGGGEPLPVSERAFFEPRFGQDFNSVRIHTGDEATALARAVDARAFTVENNIVFGAGEYQPGTTAGRELLAHELTHTVQQGAVAPAQDLQRKVPASIQRDETQEITFEEGITFGEGPNILPDIDFLQSRVERYLQHFRDSNQEACLVFANTMFHETSETAEPDLLSAVLKKGMEIGKDKLAEAIAERIPGFDIVVDLVGAVVDEVERANRARREVALVDFINDHVMLVGQRIQQLSEQIGSDEVREQLYIEIQDSGQAETFAREARGVANSLRAPSNNEILRALTESYVRENTSVSTERGILGYDQWASGVLYLEYSVNEEETQARLVEKKLISPYAPQIKALLRRTIGERIDTSTLNFTRVVRLEREDVRVMADVHQVRPGEQAPDERGLRYFTRLVQRMPTLALSEIEATDSAVIID